MTEPPAPPLPARLRPGHWILLDWAVVLLMAVLATLGWRELAGMHGLRTLDALIVAASILPAGFRRLRTAAVLAVVTVAGALAIARSAEPAPALAAAYVMYLIPLRHERREAVRILAATVGVLVLGPLLLVPPPYAAPVGSPVPILLTSLACVTGAWTLGYAVSQQRAYATAQRRLREHELHEAAERRIAEARRAQSEQRLEIARELHDVVAHSLSVIAVQAGVANYVAAQRPDEAARALASIEETSRDALREMRALLGVLRDDATLAPAPGLGDVGEVVGRAQDAGVRVELVVDGQRPVLPAGLDLAAYRVVQEAVTNVIKHSGAASCRVGIAYHDAAVRLEVVDHGRGGPATGSGHGLVGMRERAAMYGGAVEAGPLPGGRGFRVAAVFPLAPAASDPGGAEPAEPAGPVLADPTETR